MTIPEDSLNRSPDLKHTSLLMKLSNDLLCLYSGQIEKQEDKFVIEVPENEIAIGDIDPETVYRIALLSTRNTATNDGESQSNQGGQGPPVQAGEQRTVDIDDIGEQGDGIARVERGYVVIVPDTEQGERVTIEITDVSENVAFAQVLEREDYYN